MNNLKIVFMGTPDFAVPCLKTLNENYEVIAVITQPDRPKGRGQKLTPSPIKEYALEHNLTVLQPEKIKTSETEEQLKKLAPDLIVVVAFGQILSKAILDIPQLGCINVHASLLPKYRGAAPIHWSIINGETKTGITTMYMDVGLDTGDMILKEEVSISAKMNTGELHDTLMNIGAKTLLQTIKQIAEGSVVRNKQNDAKASYAPLLTKELERINWLLPAQEIYNLVRGLNPWPVAFSIFKGKKLKIWQTKVIDNVTIGEIGTVLSLTETGFTVQTGKGILEILELQPESKRKMTAKDFVCGNQISINDKLE
ncbi:MAG: methionyl-tRNA formyltransferase [Negativicutes bacterium]|nr:methionyl-tRNA formyltransferase [Negativicutes bacterium]MBP9949376.1 methionyl-tRNA formyltransferase [Negativicutes bacterium]